MLGPIAFLFLLFPTGTPPSHRWGWLLRVMLVALGVNVFFFAFTPGPMTAGFIDLETEVVNPFGLPASWQRATEIIAEIAGVTVAIGALVSVVSLFQRSRRADEVERQQIRWLQALGVLLGVVLRDLIASNAAGTVDEEGPVNAVMFFVVAFGLFFGLPITCAIAILRYHLYDLDVVVKKTVLYAVLVVLILAVLGAGALILGAVAVPETWRRPRRSSSASCRARASGRSAGWPPVSPIASSTAVGPRLRGDDDILAPGERHLRQRGHPAEDGGDRGRDDPRGVGGGLAPVGRRVPARRRPRPHGARARGRWPPGATSCRRCRPITSPRSATRASCWAPSPSRCRPTIRSTAPASGWWMTWRRRPAPCSATCASSRSCARRGSASWRRRTSSAGRLERNLHDGAQQHLVALAVKQRLAGRCWTAIRTGRDAHGGDPVGHGRGPREPPRPRARHLPAAARRQGAARGARGAGAEGADRGARRGRRPGPLPAKTSRRPCTSAAWRRCRTSRSTRTRPRPSWGSPRRDGWLRFTVRDDGRGFDRATTAMGTGVQGMADRLEAAGGALEVRSEPDRGTTVEGRVPVARP